MRSFDDGDLLYGAEVTAVFKEALANGTAILSGCAPSAAGGLDVSVASGSAATGNTKESVGSSTVTLAARDSFDRYDLVTIASGGSVTTHTGSTQLKAPSLPSGEALVAVVKVPSSSDGSAITVNDSRVLLSTLHVDTFVARQLTLDTLNTDDVVAFDELDIPVVSSDLSTTGALWYRSDLD